MGDRQGDYGVFERVGRAFDDANWPKTRDTMIEQVTLYLDSSGMFNEHEVALDPYELFKTGALLNWASAIKLMSDFMEHPFSGPSGHQYLCHRLYANTDDYEYMIVLTTNDNKGVIDTVLVWEFDAETYAIARQAHMPVVATMLREIASG